jgi:WD40 repeat protein
MNLELLDPFGRQIPDRVDSTLHLPKSLHFPSNNNDYNNNEKEVTPKSKISASDELALKAVTFVAFNRRGSYIAVAYASGTIAIFDILSRTPSCIYRFQEEEEQQQKQHQRMITVISWSRRSRTLLVGCMGSPEVMLMDLTHPAGPEECCAQGGVKINDTKDNGTGGGEDHGGDRSHSPVHNPGKQNNSSSCKSIAESSFAARSNIDFHPKDSRVVSTKMIQARKDDTTSGYTTYTTTSLSRRKGLIPTKDSNVYRHPCVRFSFPEPLGGGSSLQIHPKDSLAGQAVLQDGSIVVFKVRQEAFETADVARDISCEETDSLSPPHVFLSRVYESTDYIISCASFDPHGQKLYAATTGGKFMGFEVASLFEKFWSNESEELPSLEPNFVISLPGGARVWHILVSRNGRYVVLNSADAAIRLYETSECWRAPQNVEKPVFVFQDVVQKVKFVSCDISGDGEYIAGGAQGGDPRYQVYIWNTNTGVLVDKLVGAPVHLSSVAWHPTRSFLAVAASDGLVDRWGPRINWTAFAPDFQALPQNVEYIEQEDEFDIVDDGVGHDGEKDGQKEDEETAHVDILTLHKIPVFQSDSEDESDVFHFEVFKRAAGSISTGS